MKLLVLVLALAVGARAGRPGALEVIDNFKEIVPKFADSMTRNEEQLLHMENQGSDSIVQFHSDIMRAKETFVLSITKQEDLLNNVLRGQNLTVVDSLCMSFISKATNENVNLIGVAYTTCVNAADEALNTTTSSYYGSIGEMDQSILDMHLLDVFRGDNVFYTPENILAKLNQKLNNFVGGVVPQAALQEEIQELQRDLEGIRATYIECMTTAEVSFRSYMKLANKQLVDICGGDAEGASN